ncbi:GRIP and coiled-coil domain-containing protein 1 isoform X2 [Ambystoma mexicanum]
MEKFGMNFGVGAGKKELLDTIENQKKQLLQYQTRLKDVVRAYKGLLKEKEALEASLKVLSASHEADVNLDITNVNSSPSLTDGPDDGCSLHSEDSVGTAASVDTAASLTSAKGELTEEDRLGTDVSAVNGPPLPKQEEANGSESGMSTGNGEVVATVLSEVDKRVLQTKNQLATLTNALTTVTQEKSRMEASYQADKRKMKQEMDDLIKKASDETKWFEEELKSAQDQLAETKARLITQQHDRAQEQNDHAVMLRELQKLLQAERAQRQDVELKLEDMRGSLAGRVNLEERVGEFEVLVMQLNHELEQRSRELQATKNERSRPDPRLQEMEKEMANMKTHFQTQLQQEMAKTAQIEEHLRLYSQMEEQRVASLESQVSEVSELLGTYEKAKQKDQMTIQKLRDRIVQLDMENKTLAIAASSRSLVEMNMEEPSLDINVLKDKMERLKKLLQLAAKKSPQTLDIEKLCEIELAKSNDATDGEKATALYYQQELKQLKEEFERYKMRAQVVLKNKNTKDSNLAKELEETQEQVAELKEKYIALRLSCEEMERQHAGEMEAKKQELVHLALLHKQELEKCQLEYREKTAMLDEEMHKQRDRTLSLLSEKDLELEQLRSTASCHGFPGNKSFTASAGEANPDNTVGLSSQDGLTQALQLNAASEPTFLLYVEQLSRKEVEIGALRKQKHKLEVEVHQLQDKLLVEGEQHRDQVSALQGLLQKDLRDKGREGANLEYLKNIVYRFLTLPDLFGRQQTLSAILTILHFSPEEKRVVLQHQSGGSWWHSGKR